jgi:hypothetical protein
MKITLKNTPEQVELVKAMASRNRDVAYEAQTALAEFIGPVLAEVINNAPALSNLFTTLQYNADDNPSIPLDLYFDVADEDYVQVYSQSRAGGLPTSEVQPTSSELKIATYSLDSAVSFDRRYAAKSRMDVVAKTMTRVAQEILLKQNKISANVVMKAVGGSTNGSAVTNGLNHVFESAAVNAFGLADLNNLITRSKRIVTSFVGGTPDASQGNGITDIICSPEIVEKLRAIAYNPINNGVQNNDFLAEEAYRAAGAPSFYGINIIELLEMGVGKDFNTVFDANSSGTLKEVGGAAGSGAFDGTTDELVLGIDRSRESLIRPVAVDSESGGEFSLIADDQYSIRQSKVGYFGSLEEGRVVVDNRALIGVAVITN